jgi:hypothetical protein
MIGRRAPSIMLYVIKVLRRYGCSIFLENQGRKIFLAQTLCFARYRYSSPKGHLCRRHSSAPVARCVTSVRGLTYRRIGRASQSYPCARIVASSSTIGQQAAAPGCSILLASSCSRVPLSYRPQDLRPRRAERNIDPIPHSGGSRASDDRDLFTSIASNVKWFTPLSPRPVL